MTESRVLNQYSKRHVSNVIRHKASFDAPRLTFEMVAERLKFLVKIL